MTREPNLFSLPTIWFNLSTSTDWHRPPVGIVRVERALFEAMTALLGPDRLRPCVWRDGQFCATTTQGDGAKEGTQESPRAGEFLITLGLDWDRPYPAEFFRLANEEGLRIITCCYDLIPILFPQYCVGDVALRFKDYLNHLLWGSEAVLCISANTERDLLHYAARIGAPIPLTRVITLGDQISSAQGAISAALIEPLNALIAQPFLLYVSTIERRKNHELLYRALRLLCQQRDPATLPKLVFVGMPGWHVDDLLHDLALDPLTKGLIVQLHEVSDAELQILYRHALFCLYPSIYEGWGLPIAEALAMGKVILASDQASMPEVGGDLVPTYSPWNAPAWADAIANFLDHPQQLAALEARIRSEYQPRTWEATARSVLQLIEQRVGHHANAAVTPAHAEPASALASASASASEFASESASEFTSASAPPAASAKDEAEAQVIPPRHFFVDVSELIQGDSQSGIQRVVRSILAALLAAPPAGYVVVPVFARAEHGYCMAQGFTGQASPSRSWPTDAPLLPRRGDLFLGLDLLPYLVAQHAAYYTQLQHIGVEVYFVAYDLLPIAMTQYFSPESQRVFTRWLETVAQADGIVAISRAVADDIRQRLPELSPAFQAAAAQRRRPLKLGWFHLGADLQASLPSSGLPADADAVLQRLARRPTFLMVGTVEPRKGHRQALEAFERLWDIGLEVNLVIAGKRGWRVDALSRALLANAECNDHLTWLDGISDDYLARLYEQADCLLIASEGEGFGLPLIEAASHDLPIIARDLPVLREVAGEHAIYFSGLDPDAIADCVQRWLDLRANAQLPSSAAMPRKDWQQSTAQLLDVLLEGHWQDD